MEEEEGGGRRKEEGGGAGNHATAIPAVRMRYPDR